MKKKYVISLVIIVLIIGYFAPNIIKIVNRGKLVDVISGEEMLNIPLYTYKGDKVYSYELLKKNSNNTLIFYLSTSCGACIEMLDTISILTNVFDDYYDCIVIWEDEIPINRIKKHNIDTTINYSLNNKIRLGGVKPYSFIVSSYDKKVIFETSNFESIINRLFNEVSKDDLLKSANKYFYEIDQKEVYLFFKTNDCEDCIELSQRLDELKNSIPLISISSESMYEYSKNQLHIYDIYEVCMKIYDIKSYPFIVKVCNDENSRILNLEEMTDSF